MEIEIPGVNMAELKLQGFKVHELPAFVNIPAIHGRRDFYKMGLVTGEMTIGYGGRVLELKDTVLFFVNPKVPRSVVRRSEHTTGYACIFTESFMPAIVKKSPLFNANENPVIRLNPEQTAFMTGIFQKMLTAHHSDYSYKGDLIRSCIELIIHESLTIQPPVQALPTCSRICWKDSFPSSTPQNHFACANRRTLRSSFPFTSITSTVPLNK